MIHARSEVWPGQVPTNNNGTVRAKLAPFRPYLTVHHGGAGTWLDPNDTPTELRAVQAFAAGPSKRTPWEYNYVVDGQGEIWTYAGEYQAAHSSGENEIAIGVLLLINAEVEQPTEPMIDAFRFLRYTLVEGGLLSDVHMLRQHRQMPGASTACPGKNVVARWADFSAPWHPSVPKPPTPPTPPPPPLEDDMADTIINNAEPGLGAVNKVKFRLMEDGTLRHLEEDEWRARGAVEGTPWTNAQISKAGTYKAE